MRAGSSARSASSPGSCSPASSSSSRSSGSWRGRTRAVGAREVADWRSRGAGNVGGLARTDAAVARAGVDRGAASTEGASHRVIAFLLSLREQESDPPLVATGRIRETGRSRHTLRQGEGSIWRRRISDRDVRDSPILKQPEPAAVETRGARALRHGRRARLYAWALVGIVALVVLIALVAANARSVKLDWVFGSGHASLVWIVLGAAVLGWLLGIATCILFSTGRASHDTPATRFAADARDEHADTRERTRRAGRVGRRTRGRRRRPRRRGSRRSTRRRATARDLEKRAVVADLRVAEANVALHRRRST